MSQIQEHSPLPWRSVYPLGSKQRCAAVDAGDHYVYLYVAESDAVRETIRMHQANADLIVKAVNNYAALEAQVGALQRENERLPRECKHCHRAIYSPTNETPFWHDSDNFASFYCRIDHEHHEPTTQESGQ